MKRLIIASALFLLAAAPRAQAQGAVLLQKPITAGHCSTFVSPNLIADAGSTCSSGGWLGNKVTINTAPNTNNQGLLIHQSGPASGSIAGPLNYNEINLTFRSTVTGSGFPGQPGCACVTPLQVSTAVGGANFSATEVYGASFGVTHDQDDTSTSDKVGASSGVYSNHSSLGRIYGFAGGATLDTGGSAPNLLGSEFDVRITGGSTDYRLGVNAWSGGTGHGTLQDAAFSIGVSGGMGEVGWKTGILLFTENGALANQPITTDGTLLKSDKAVTITNGFDLSNITFTGNIIDATPNGYVVDTNGKTIGASVEVYAATPTAPSGHVTFGSSTVAAGSGTCPSGTVGGQTVQGCLVINVGGTPRNLPFF